MSTYRNDDPKHFSEAMQSIWEVQEVKPDEIVLVVDGPIENELNSRIEHWKKVIGEEIFKVIYQKENLGLPSSLNNGISYCTGDYIARMDADDISLPNRFCIQKKFMSENENIAVLGGAIEEFHENSNFTQKRFYPKNTTNIRDEFLKASPFAHPTVVIRRDVLEKYRYNESLTSTKGKVVSSNEDIDLWIRLIKAGYEMANLDTVILKYRKNATFYKRRSKDKAIAELKVYLKGAYSVHGVSIKLIFPFLRFLSRMTPQKFNKYLYSKRNILLSKK